MYWANINNNPKGAYSEKFITKIKISNETKFSGAQKLHRSAIYSFGDLRS